MSYWAIEHSVIIYSRSEGNIKSVCFPELDESANRNVVL